MVGDARPGLGEVIEVPLDECEVDERFLYRARYEVGDLVESIRRVQIEPAVAWRDPVAGRYMVFAGVRRLMAAREARARYGEPSTFLVRLVPPDTPPGEMWWLALEENMRQSKVTDLDLALAIRAAGDVIRGIGEEKYRCLVEASRVTGEEVEDFLAAEDMVREVTGFEHHLTCYHIAALVGKDRYTRVVGAFYALYNGYRSEAMRRIEALVGSFSPMLFHPPLARYLRDHGIEPQAEPSGGGGGGPRILRLHEAMERAGGLPHEEAVSPPAPVPKLPREGEVEEPEPEAKELRVLVEEGRDEFDFTCPNCGERYHIVLVRRIQTAP